MRLSYNIFSVPFLANGTTECSEADGFLLKRSKLKQAVKTKRCIMPVLGICVRPWNIIPCMPPFFKAVKKMVEQRMSYLLTTLIELKAALSRIGDGLRFMYKYMVPWLFLVGLCVVGLVPIFICHTPGIRCHHYTAITIAHMTNYVARCVLR